MAAGQLRQSAALAKGLIKTLPWAVHYALLAEPQGAASDGRTLEHRSRDLELLGQRKNGGLLLKKLAKTTNPAELHQLVEQSKETPKLRLLVLGMGEALLYTQSLAVAVCLPGPQG